MSRDKAQHLVEQLPAGIIETCSTHTVVRNLSQRPLDRWISVYVN